MFLSFVCGFVISRFKIERKISYLAAVLLGTTLGLLGSIGVVGVVYPFYVAGVVDILWIPEVALYAIFFITPQVKIYLFEGAWLSSEMPLNPIVFTILSLTSIASVIIGELVGQRWISQPHKTTELP